jgi:uncharacterized protein YjeT (DUF2065 family)
MITIYSFTLVFGLIVIIFGISLALFPKFWRSFGRGWGEVNAVTNNAGLKITGFSRFIKYKGVDEKYMPSDKGMIITGIVFVVLGIIIILIPYF